MHRNPARFLPALLLLVGCVTTTTPMVEEPGEDRITVSVMQSGRARGCRAEFFVEAPVATVSRVLVSTQSSREVRPMVAGARIIRRDQNSGLIVLTFVPELGIPGTATYRYVTEDTAGGGFRYRFQMVSTEARGPQGIDVRGSYTVTPEPREGGCRVVYEFSSSSAKLRRDRLLKLIKQEASSIANLSEKATGALSQ
jgi:hypothetical protein